ncbi:MAG: biotin transporter BioY [Pseudomonadota bacterium]
MLGRLVLGPLLGLVISITLGAALIAGGAEIRLSLPGTSIPQTLQTLAVLLVGGLFGPFAGVLAVLAYLGLGVAGVPVFADDGAGWARLTGPTAGYLWGFVGAAAVMGLWPVRRSIAGLATLLLGALLAHTVVLAAGWWHLSQAIGYVNAFERGVEPFLLGALAKSVAAALLLWIWRQIRTRLRVPSFLLPPV